MSNSFATPWNVAHQASLFMGFPRQEYWNGLSFPSPGDLPNSGIKPRSPAWQAGSLALSHGEAHFWRYTIYISFIYGTCKAGCWLSSLDCTLSRILPQVGNDQCLLSFLSTAQFRLTLIIIGFIPPPSAQSKERHWLEMN